MGQFVWRLCGMTAGIILCVTSILGAHDQDSLDEEDAEVQSILNKRALTATPLHWVSDRTFADNLDALKAQSDTVIELLWIQESAPTSPLSKETFQSFLAVLETCTVMQSITLRHFQWTCEQGKQLADTLKKLKTLRCIDLKGHAFELSGLWDFYDAFPEESGYTLVLD